MSDTVTPDELERMMKEETPPRLLAVRRSSDRQGDPSGIPGADWKDPEKVTEWVRDLGNSEVVVYCVRCGSARRSVQEKLRELNVNVKLIEGGLEAWMNAGKPVDRP